MKRIRYTAFAGLALALPMAASLAFATPVPNSAALNPRIFNDCGSSILVPTNAYPALIEYAETKNLCTGTPFANRHNWRFSQDGINAISFMNGDIFSYECDVTLDGTGNCEGGLEIAPWFSGDVGGRFQVRTTDGEIACFDGVLPFYSFTASQGLTYTKGTTVHMGILYRPRDNAPPNYGTITYTIVIGGTPYTSGPLNMDGCNFGEQPIYGCYGILNFAKVGGFVQNFMGSGGAAGTFDAKWGNIVFSTAPTAAKSATWGRIKTLYR